MTVRFFLIAIGVGQSGLSKDFETKALYINDHHVGHDFYDNGNGILLSAGLRKKVLEYNQSKTGINRNAIPINHSILEIEAGKIGGYCNLFI